MSVITKSVVFGALISAALVVGPLLSQDSHRATAESAVQPAAMSRVSTTAEPEVANSTTTSPASCTGQAWPYVARECLAAADGTPARKAVRQIGITR